MNRFFHFFTILIVIGTFFNLENYSFISELVQKWLKRKQCLDKTYLLFAPDDLESVLNMLFQVKNWLSLKKILFLN